MGFVILYAAKFMAKKRKRLSKTKSSNPVGRPTVMTPETIRKLETAFLLGCSDNEACFSAGIGRSTLADYERDHPEFSERKKALKNNPVFVARQTILNAMMQGDAKTAMWFLERKRRSEFGKESRLTAEIQHGVIQPIDMNDWANEQNCAFLGLESESEASEE